MSPPWKWIASRTGLLFATSIVLVIGSEPRWLSCTAMLLPPVSNSLYTPTHAWQVPLSLVPGIENVSRWPWLAYAVLVATIVTSFARLCGLTFVALLTTSALSLDCDAANILPAVALLAITLGEDAQESGQSVFVRVLWIGFGSVLAIVGTLEFGLVLFVALWALSSPIKYTPDQSKRMPRNGFYITAGILSIIGFSLFSTGFRGCLLRPLSCFPASRYTELLPTLSPSYHFLGNWETSLLLGCLGLSWANIALSRNTGLWRLIPATLLTALGVGCQRYLWISVFAVAALGRQRMSVPRKTVAAWAGTVIVFSCAAVLFVVRTDWLTVMAGDVAAARIDPSAWNLRGPVVLLDLDQSTHWQTGAGRNRHRLVMDDRWDIHGDRYGEYSLACQDLRDSRQHSYLRTDDSWGGYDRWLKSWRPILLVADPMDGMEMRRLSLSNDWRMMGMDGQSAIFGRAGDASTLPIMSAALNCLLTLEWPANVENLDVEATIVAATPEDRRTVAGVLCAMRLPYAALRFLRNDRSPMADDHRTACYVELAHRIQSHSGEPSLLDQFRAVARIRERASIADLDDRERSRLSRNLLSLGLADLARELFSGDQVAPSSLAGTTATEQEAIPIKRALARGDWNQCRNLITDLSEPDRSYYAIFLESLSKTPENVRDDLGTFMSLHPELDTRLRAEALFYQGCAALEAGDVRQAILSLGQSEQLALDLPLSSIRRAFLTRLTSEPEAQGSAQP